jgi:hypothetical protein
MGSLVVALDESIDVFPELSDAGEACALRGLAAEDREPALDLVEPGGMRRREMEVNVLMSGEPAVALGLVGFEVVEDDVDFARGVSVHDMVHEIEELDTAPPAAVTVQRKSISCSGALGRRALTAAENPGRITDVSSVDAS